jgi:ATP-dependent Lhr-like helicase
MVKMTETFPDIFHPLIRHWFEMNFRKPTGIQLKAWSAIAAGKHCLISAPTGSGKTLTAFLWSLNQLISGQWPLHQTSVLYISPLKALNHDIYRNLLGPLVQIRAIFQERDLGFKDIQVMTRSGDTPPSDRRKMTRHPPEILITTPESLNILLSSGSGQQILAHLQTVILDEVHALMNSKRGIHLFTAVERLVLLSGEFQRIALSATVNPPELVAEYIGGYRFTDDSQYTRTRESGPDSRYRLRPVAVLRTDEKKHYKLRVLQPEMHEPDSRQPFWDPYIEDFLRIIQKNRSTLFFVSSRKMAETITLRINTASQTPLAYAHHGSLSREIRHEVEQRFKSGELKAIVATGSLEMGIDIGDLDEVVLIQSPQFISTAIQRIGRAGHHVGEISCGSFYPIDEHDLIESAVLARAVIDGTIEPVQPVQQPLDVLAQIIISMICTVSWNLDDLYNRIRTCKAYHQLSRKEFDLVIDMLDGRYAETRIRELKPRIFVDKAENVASPARGSRLALYLSGGTIPDRGYFQMRHKDTGARIGELDEEFVWEAKTGQNFTFGTQNWQIQKITHNEVFVRPAGPRAAASPFWKGEATQRSALLSEFISEFLETADLRMHQSGFDQWLQEQYCLDAKAAERLHQYLLRQKEKTGCPLPHRHNLVIEHVSSGPGGVPGHQLILHNFWGGRLNQPFAMALGAAWENRHHEHIEIYPANDCISLVLTSEISGTNLLDLISGMDIPKLLRQRLEGSGFFGAQFRENAGRALLLQKSRLNERLPLWMSRLKSQKMLNTVMRYEDFPILIETWRSCQHEFDLEALQSMLDELRTGMIKVSECRTVKPSPMAAHLTFRQINQYMYMDDVLKSGKTSSLREDLLRDVIFQPGLRPLLSHETVEQFELKRRRLHPGYAPASSKELIHWVKERWMIPEKEWGYLKDAIQRDYPENAESIFRTSESKLIWIQPNSSAIRLLVAYDNLKPVQQFLSLSQFPDKTSKNEDEARTRILREWFSFYGPKSLEWIIKTLGIPDAIAGLTQNLLDTEQWIVGHLLKGADKESICDLDNYEKLLRLNRTLKKFKGLTRPVSDLTWFLAKIQGICETKHDLFETLEPLTAFSAPVWHWEAEYFPARDPQYHPNKLDSVLQENRLIWAGSGPEKIAFIHPLDLDLLPAGSKRIPSAIESLFIDPAARYHFSALLNQSQKSASELNETLWDSVWKGIISNDNYGIVRKGFEHKFQLPVSPSSESKTDVRSYRASRRYRFQEWKGTLPWAGSWFIIRPDKEEPPEPLEREEMGKDRVRILLARYGILFRELLQRELPVFQWNQVFRSLRLMELAGEVIAGYFFENISGPQFISPQALRLFQENWKTEIYWLNAADPASVCGLPLPEVRQTHPRRLDRTHVVYRGSELIFISERAGKNLEFRISPEDPDVGQAIAPLHHLLCRTMHPLNRIVIETINGLNAAGSPYVQVFREHFESLVDYKTITIYRQI